MLYVGNILRENEDLGPHLRSKLLAFFDDSQVTSNLRVETVDWGEPFVKACYTLEGDRPLSFEIIGKVKLLLLC